MKDKVLKILELLIEWLSFQYTKLATSVTGDLPYNSLAPTRNAEKAEDYLTTLEWALNNRKEIKNIAISGSYGSGKSSVLKTFQTRHKHNNKFYFLNLSLATFKDDKSINKDINAPDNNDILRLIELSILQQLFYHEKDNKIPDSRFKKIKNNKTTFLWLSTVGILVFTVSFLFLVFPKFLSKFSLLELTPENSQFFHYLSVTIVAIGSVITLFKSLRVIKGITLKKIGISNASIEIDEKISKSILNNHLDEILYFFEVTKYNVVIIEDLDRFEQTDVFTKLREINLLINNSKKIEDDIVFVYAIRDDMFLDKDRTKFFDFMIPIIPVINSSNSNDKLLKLIERNGYCISDDLVEDIALFIDDMRLLFNIMNEYHLYFQKLNKDLNQDKLLSMIVYKNIYPNDFTKLSQNEGELYTTITDKYKYIKEKLNQLNKDSLAVKDKITKAESNNIKDIAELRIIYLSKIIEKIKQSHPTHPFFHFWLSNRIVNITQATDDENFNLIINTNNLNYTYNNNQSYRQSYRLEFTEIENEVNPKLSYAEREELIFNSKNIEKLKTELVELDAKKSAIRKLRLKDLISENIIDRHTNNEKQKRLINILLRNGYIDEDYLDYISIFYEGSLSKNDHQFLVNIKTQKETEYDFPLQKIENLIKKINVFDFEKEYILNYTLMDHVIESSNFQDKRSKYLSLLASESDNVIRFIDGFIDHTPNLEKFIQLLCKNWIGIWSFIKIKSNYPNEKVNNYFKLIIENADLNDIKIIFSKSIDSISENENFLLLIENKQRLKSIIKELNVRFKLLNKSADKELLDYVYENNHYEINTKTIKFILQSKDKFDAELFVTCNYTQLKQSKLDNLIKYVDNNIDKYITSVYLTIETNTQEAEEKYIALLNNASISYDTRVKIIKQVETSISDINTINDFMLVEHLLNESRVLPIWKNILDIYIQSENKFTSELTSFLNIDKNTEELSKKQIETDTPDEDTVKNFLASLLLNDAIEDACYSQLLLSIPYVYDSLSIEGLSFEKVKSLIENNILTTNSTNFELLKDSFERLHITLLENNPNKFVNEIDSFEIEKKDLLGILKSTSIPIQLKGKIIMYNDETTFKLDSKLLTEIGLLLLKHNSFDVSSDIIKSVGTDSNLTTSDKIKLFNKTHKIYGDDSVSEFLISLGNPYSIVTENGKRPILENNQTNKDLVKNLDNMDYISGFNEEKKGIRISTYRNK
jgi:hypothetical protein